jgi:O-methyltransferase involved in polyketide biosynthesis
MGITLPEFTPMEDSLFLTLCGRALVSRSPRSILHDTTADEIVRKLDYDCEQYRLSTSPIINIAHRSKKLDLGVGLDSRMVRVAPPSTVDWYDVDFPNVVAARKLLIPQSLKAHSISVNLTDPDWLDEVPIDQPAVIVADGLLAFLTQDDMIALLDRLTSHFPSGEIAFNGYTRFAIWAAKHYHGTQSVADLIKSPGFDDPREPERWNPKLKLVREILLTREPEVAEFPFALREFTRLAAHSTWLSRRGTTVLQYEFVGDG